jgi:hypothetical protein
MSPKQNLHNPKFVKMEACTILTQALQVIAGTLKITNYMPSNNTNPSLSIFSNITILYFKVSKHTPQK